MATIPRPSDRRVQTVCLMILALIASGVALWLLRPVLVPFVLAIFFAECLAPLIETQVQRWRMPRWLAVTTASIVGLGLLIGAGFIVGSSVNRMADYLPAYKQSLDKSSHQLAASRVAKLVGIHTDLGATAVTKEFTVEFVSDALGETTNIVRNGAMVVLLLAFLLFGRRQEPTDRSGIIAEIEGRVQRYISLTVFISALTGVLVGATLSILGVPFAPLFAFLAFLLNFVPNLGGVITTLLPLPIIWLNPEMSIVAKLLALAIPGGIQVLIGSVVQPKMLGDSLELHPIVLLLALLFFTMIWGVAGAFLATPLTAVIKIVFERIPATSALAALLAGDLGPLTRTIDQAPAPPIELWPSEPQETQWRGRR